jgi:hypothetical protein
VRRYATRPRPASRAARRYDQRRMERWNRLRDLVTGAPSAENQAEPAAQPRTILPIRKLERIPTGCGSRRARLITCSEGNKSREHKETDVQELVATPSPGQVDLSHSVGCPVTLAMRSKSLS